MNKKVLIVGASISGLSLAIFLKRSNHDFDITVIDHASKPMKKIYATGNGRCNFANLGSIDDVYRNSSFVNNIINSFNANEIINFMKTLNIASRSIDNLVYPYSLSSESVVNGYLNECKILEIKIIVDVNFIDYKKTSDQEFEINTSIGKMQSNYLIFACGGKSNPNLGSDGSIFDVLRKHSYTITPLVPGLCPCKVTQDVKKLDGVRAKCLISLYNNQGLIHKEQGEILFKKDGISGIAVFNLSSLIARENPSNFYRFEVDFIPEVDSLTISSVDMYLPNKLLQFIKDLSFKLKMPLNDLVKQFSLTYKILYSFNDSQVTVGGVSINDLSTSLQSNKENDIFFVGEIIDADGLCGGYNIMWSIASAFCVSNAIARKVNNDDKK